MTNNRLTALPDSIGMLTKLRELNLRHNRITALPVTIGGLGELRRLYVQLNELTELPTELGNLSHLRHLWAFNNSLRSLPTSLLQLTAIKTLSVRDNPLEPTVLREFSDAHLLESLRCLVMSASEHPQPLVVSHGQLLDLSAGATAASREGLPASSVVVTIDPVPSVASLSPSVEEVEATTEDVIARLTQVAAAASADPDGHFHSSFVRSPKPNNFR